MWIRLKHWHRWKVMVGSSCWNQFYLVTWLVVLFFFFCAFDYSWVLFYLLIYPFFHSSILIFTWSFRLLLDLLNTWFWSLTFSQLVQIKDGGCLRPKNWRIWLEFYGVFSTFLVRVPCYLCALLNYGLICFNQVFQNLFLAR